MTARRACVVLTLVSGLAVAVVHLRAEQTGAAAGVFALEAQSAVLRRELWRLQTEIARLRTPARLHYAADWFEMNLAQGQHEHNERGSHLRG